MQGSELRARSDGPKTSTSRPSAPCFASRLRPDLSGLRRPKAEAMRRLALCFSNDQHCITVSPEPVLLLYSGSVGFEDEPKSAEGSNHHKKS